MSRPNSAAPAADLSDVGLSEARIDALFSCFTSYRSLLLAVSGGSDSLALMVLAQAWQQRHADGAIPKITIASIDHGLRATSAADVEFVEERAMALGFSFLALKWDGAKPVSAIQAHARNARHELLKAAARQHGCDAIVMAHTLDDQAETVLMRLMRGSGVTGLQGMAAVMRFENEDNSDHFKNIVAVVPPPRKGGGNINSKYNNIDLLRPLLGVSRAALRATLTHFNHSWREDASNENMDFLRPRLRRILPLLSAEGLDANRLATMAKKMARADEALEHAAQTLIAQIYEQKIERAIYQQAPCEIRHRFLKHLVAASSRSTYPPGDEALEELDRALCDATAARRTLGGILFSIGPRFLRFSPENDSRTASKPS